MINTLQICYRPERLIGVSVRRRRYIRLKVGKVIINRNRRVRSRSYGLHIYQI